MRQALAGLSRVRVLGPDTMSPACSSVAAFDPLRLTGKLAV